MESSSMDSNSSTQEYERPQTRSNCTDDKQGVIDKSRDDQRTAWNKLHVTIGYLVYKVNAVNIGTVKKELLQQNMIRGKHMFCRFIIQAQSTLTSDTHVYATLVAVINRVLPEIGKLVLEKCILLFQNAYLNSEILNCSASVMFIGHLINHGVVDEKLAVDLFTILLKQWNIFSIKIAIVILETCGKKISETHADILNEVFGNMLNFLNKQKELDEEYENVLERLWDLLEYGFKFLQLDLVPANECQKAHFQNIMVYVEPSSNNIGYQFEEKFELNDQMYKNFILNIEGNYSEEENELESVTDFNNQYDTEKKLIEVMKHINYIENDTNMLSLRKVSLRKLINLTDWKIDYTNFARNIVKHCQFDMDLFNMIMDCCCEHSTYINHFGSLTKELIEADESFGNVVEIAFIYCYVTSDKFDSHRTQIVSSYFAQLWDILPCKLLSLLEEKSIYANTRYSTILFQKYNNILKKSE